MEPSRTILITGDFGCSRSASQERIAELAAEYEDLHPLPFRDYEIRTSVFVVNLLVSWALVAGLLAFLVAAHSSPPSL